MTRTWCRTHAVAAMILAGCGGGDGGTGPAATPVVTTVEVTLAPALLVGDTAVATATVKDQNGAVMTGKTVVWSIAGGTGASITGAGVVTGTAAGTASIAATVEGKSGNASVAITTDDRFGYAWADNQTATSYTPDNGYSHNSSGAAITISRAAAGVYAVRFNSLAATGARRTGVQISAYSSGSNHCKSAGWNTTGADLIVEVRCYTQAGTAADARFTVLVTGGTALGGRAGFGYLDVAAAAPISVPAQARSSRGKGIRVAHEGPGAYDVSFDGLVRQAGDTPEQTMVTAVGEGSERCTIAGWDYSTFSVAVRCYNPAGALTDSRFSVLVIEKGRPGRKLGFAWANDATAASYTPSSQYSLNDGGGATTITRGAVGGYSVSFTGLTRTTESTETVLVAAYGSSSQCRIGSWGGTFSVTVSCYDPAGNPIDSRFDVIVVQ